MCACGHVSVQYVCVAVVSVLCVCCLCLSLSVCAWTYGACACFVYVHHAAYLHICFTNMCVPKFEIAFRLILTGVVSEDNTAVLCSVRAESAAVGALFP